MKNFLTLLFSIVLIAVGLTSAHGQTFNLYQQSTLVQLLNPTAVAQSTNAEFASTNRVYDMRGFIGLGSLYINQVSNSAAAASTFSVRIEGSDDGSTGWTNLTGLASSTYSSVILTNFIVGTTNLTVYTNSYYAPGETYSTLMAYTNSSTTNFEYGVNMNSQKRFWRVIVNVPSGSNAVYGVSATFRGTRKYRY